jgi:hypothetical protein
MSLFELPILECRGDARALGHAQGEALRERIALFTDQRLSAFDQYSRERGGPSVQEFLAVGEACWAAYQRWDPGGALEHAAIAEAASVSPAALYATTNMTDVRDVLLLPGAGNEGCTSLLVPKQRAREGVLLAGQTWDLNPSDLEFVVAVHRLATDGIETWSVTCSGALSLMGMNARGVAVGTTNIKTKRSRVGVGYLSILHRALGQASAGAARECVAGAPRAAAHTYWTADAELATELECDPADVVERRLEREPLTRTNHCLSAALRSREGEAVSNSSQRRFARAAGLLSEEPQDVSTLRQLMSDRSDGVDSINRYAEDEQGTTTNACMIAVPARLELWACRGPADRGEWRRLEFSSA